MGDGGSVQRSVRFPAELAAAVLERAVVEQRSFSQMVVVLLAVGLDEGASKGGTVPPMSGVSPPGRLAEAPSSSPPDDIFAKFVPQGPSEVKPYPKSGKKR